MQERPSTCRKLRQLCRDFSALLCVSVRTVSSPLCFCHCNLALGPILSGEYDLFSSYALTRPLLTIALLSRLA